MTPSGIEPATLPRMACDTTACPLSYGRIVDWAGGCLHRRSEKGRGLNPGGVVWALSPESKFKRPKPRKPAETLPNPPVPPATLLLLYYSCTTATPAAHAALVTRSCDT